MYANEKDKERHRRHTIRVTNFQLQDPVLTNKKKRGEKSIVLRFRAKIERGGGEGSEERIGAMFYDKALFSTEDGEEEHEI